MAGICAWFAVFVIFFEIISRTFFQYGAIFAVESSLYATAFLCFVGASYTQSLRKNITITLLTARLPQKGQDYLLTITTAAALVVDIAFLYWTVKMVQFEFERGIAMVSPMEPPAAPVHMIMVVGLGLLGLVLLTQLVQSIIILVKGRPAEVKIEGEPEL